VQNRHLKSYKGADIYVLECLRLHHFSFSFSFSFFLGGG